MSRSPQKPAGEACLTCPARDAKLVAPEFARIPEQQRVRLAVIGETPSRQDIELGRPFIGPSGKMLMRGLATLDLRRQDIHWTNAILCDCSPENLKAARKSCAKRLEAELAAVDPIISLPVGAWGLQTAAGLSKKPQIQKWRGSISIRERGSELPSYVTPTIHPAFVMRARQWSPVIEGDVARIGRLLQLHNQRERWLPPEELSGRETVVAKDLPELRQLLARLGPEVGNDVETVGLGPIETLLVCLALSDGKLTVVIPWSRGRDGRDPWWPNGQAALAAAAITDCLRRRISVTHNGPAFDHIVEARYGIKVAAWDDTLIAHHAFASQLPKNLAHVVTQYLDVGPWKQLEDRTADLPRLWNYNARDTLYTILAWFRIRDKVRSS